MGPRPGDGVVKPFSRREMAQLRRAARLHWVLFGGGVALVLASLGLARLGLETGVAVVLLSFAFGLLLAAFLISGLLVVCPSCRRSLRGVVRDRCRTCGARFVAAPDEPAG